MRIISGKAKGHRLRVIRRNSVRPTSDRVRESIFNILASRVQDAQVLDLFAGTGSLGMEALSRGAHSALFIDSNESLVKVIKENLGKLGFEESCQVWRASCFGAMEKISQSGSRFDLIFSDPPYRKALTEVVLRALDRWNLLSDGGLIVTETSKGEELPEKAYNFTACSERVYGDTKVVFWEKLLSFT